MSIVLTKAYQQVAKRLKDDILAGALPLGTKLPSERRLATQMGVSRVVIREAMKVLRTQGLVDIRHGVGTFVSLRPERLISQTLELSLILERESLSKLLELRRVLETAAANLAAARREEEDLGEIQSPLDAMEMALGRSLERWHDADLNFHLAIARSSKSPYLATLLNPVLSLTWDGLVGTFGITGPFQRYLHEHRQIYEAIRLRDSEAALQFMADHIDGVCQDLFGADAVEASSTAAAGALGRRSKGTSKRS